MFGNLLATAITSCEDVELSVAGLRKISDFRVSSEISF